ncbi:MAG: response regulator [Bacillota bacterium]
MRVLIVDDTAFMRMTLRNTLEKSGYEVIGEAENGEIGVSKYFELKPDVVTMDITMPVMDGIKAIKEIKQKDPAAKIIMVSAMGQKELVVEALRSGARDFIVKPFQTERVLEAIQKL